MPWYITAIWARVHKVDRIRPQAGGGAIVVIEDERPAREVAATAAISAAVAAIRVTTGHRVLAARYGGLGEVRYACAATLPAAVAEAVQRSGASIADASGMNVSVAALRADPIPVVTAASAAIATQVERRLDASSTKSALEALEAGLRGRRLSRDADPAAYWTAVLELVALLAQLVRPCPWVELDDPIVPFGIAFAVDRVLRPVQLAQAIVEGTTGSMLDLLQLAAPSTAERRPMPLLCHRTSVPLEQLMWEPMLDPAMDDPEMPVIMAVDDLGGHVNFLRVSGRTPSTRRAAALANLRTVAVQRKRIELPGCSAVVVGGDYFAAEKLLDDTFMAELREELGSPMLVCAVPERGLLVVSAFTGEDVQIAALTAFALQQYRAASERTRITPALIFWFDRPIGGCHNKLDDLLRALRETSPS